MKTAWYSGPIASMIGKQGANIGHELTFAFSGLRTECEANYAATQQRLFTGPHNAFQPTGTEGIWCMKTAWYSGPIASMIGKQGANIGHELTFAFSGTIFHTKSRTQKPEAESSDGSPSKWQLAVLFQASKSYPFSMIGKQGANIGHELTFAFSGTIFPLFRWVEKHYGYHAVFIPRAAPRNPKPKAPMAAHPNGN
jgi:hypothetical protein